MWRLVWISSKLKTLPLPLPLHVPVVVTSAKPLIVLAPAASVSVIQNRVFARVRRAETVANRKPVRTAFANRSLPAVP